MAATCDRCGVTLPPGDRHFVGGQDLCGSCYAQTAATPAGASGGQDQPQSARSYFYGRDGKRNGPLSEQEFFRAVADGTVKNTDVVFVPGWSDWKRLDAARALIPGLPAGPALESPPKKSSLGVGCLGVVGLFVVLAVIGSIVDPPANRRQEGTTATSPRSVTSSPSSSSRDSSLTLSQRNAVRSANSYLRISGFSRQGLIDQLSSDAGDRFSVADATAAVDSLDVDWRAQAARSAASYLKISGFSCQGLIEQLSSRAGDKYTVEQATYGATQAGICP